jgi:hypothetical protein
LLVTAKETWGLWSGVLNGKILWCGKKERLFLERNEHL